MQELTSKKRAIWVSWENQRRSIELAKSFDIPIYIISPYILPSNFRIFRYVENTIKTIFLLFRKRPEILFVQNPSMMLALIATLLKKVFNYVLVIDRHSNFKLDKMNESSMLWKLFHYISAYTIKNSDLTIVTNLFLSKLVQEWGGTGYVLEDKIPDFKLATVKSLKGKSNVVFVSTFSPDEPTREVIQAARLIKPDCFIYITGKLNKYYKMEKESPEMPKNVVFTGFLSEEDYQSLLLSSDVVLVLTKNEHTLTCGTYEGISLEKCLVISDTEALHSYFNRGMIYVKPTPESIAEGIKSGLEQQTLLEKEVHSLKKELVQKWQDDFSNLIHTINNFAEKNN